MNNGVAIIIGMATVTVATGITGVILNSLGKSAEAQIADLTCKSLLAVTALATFAKVVKSLVALG